MGKHIFFLALALTCAVGGGSRAIHCPPGDSVWLDSLLDAARRNAPMPGLATLVIKDGEVIWDRCYGYAILEDSTPVTDTTCFTLASLSKTFTATAAMQLWEDGYFDLDGDVNESLPFAVHHSRYPDSAITPRMLMTHTSAIQDNWITLNNYYSQGDPDSSLRTLLENYLTPGRPGYDSARNFYQFRPPGGGWLYCNIAYALLGFTVEAMADSFPVYTREHIFRPLGMDRTTWFFADLDTMTCACQYGWDTSRWRRLGYVGGSFYPAAFLKSCTRDLAEYLKAWLAWGRHDTARLLDSATVAMMQTPHVWSVPWQTHFGFAWYQDCVNGDTVWCHDGDEKGITTYFALSRRLNGAVVALANREYCQTLFHDVVIPALHGFIPDGIAEAPGPTVEWLLCGTFVSGTINLRGSADAVLLDISGRKVADLRPGTNDVRHLSPGVYFVAEPRTTNQELRTSTKVVVAR
ncbi:MAG: serine hydrolase [bacterium]